MLQINPLVLILLAEAVAVLVLILGVWAFLVLRRKSKDKKAIRSLISSVSESADARRTKVRAFLAGAYKLNGDPLDLAASEIDRQQNQFLKEFIQLYRKRDAAVVGEFSSLLDAVVTPYMAPTSASPEAEQNEESTIIDTPAAVDLAEGGELVSSDGALIEQLKRENAELTEELQITRETLDNMLEEYATVFAGESGPDDTARAGADGELEAGAEPPTAEPPPETGGDLFGEPEGGVVAPTDEAEPPPIAAAS